jgi:hypothetical protein
MSSMNARFAVAMALVLVANVAAAQDRDSARAAYEEGTRAFKRGDFAAAAAKYAEADALAPSPVALQAALDAAVKSDDPVLGAELLERARVRNPTGALATSVQAANAKLAHRAGKLTATCPSACVVTVDGVAFQTGAARWIVAGAHAVVFSVEGRTENRSIDVSPDAETTIAPTPPAPQPVVVEPPPPPPQQQLFVEPYVAPQRHRRGASPALFWVSLAVTGAFTITSGVDLAVTQVTHDQFVSKACASSTSADCRSLASTGNATQAVGDAFLGLSIAAAVWTLVAGALIVSWHDASIGASADAHGGTLFWKVMF